MKKYLFGLGAMLVGAGLMFVLMHGEVRADGKPMVERQPLNPFDVLKNLPLTDIPLVADCKDVQTGLNRKGEFAAKGEEGLNVEYCRIKDLSCIISGWSISCALNVV